jgi:hypothetical protein
MTANFFAKVGIFLMTFLTFEKNSHNAYERALDKCLIICRRVVFDVGMKIVYGKA